MVAQLTKLATGSYRRAEILRKAGEKEAAARPVAVQITSVVAEDRQTVKTAAAELRDATRVLQSVRA